MGLACQEHVHPTMPTPGTSSELQPHQLEGGGWDGRFCNRTHSICLRAGPTPGATWDRTDFAAPLGASPQEGCGIKWGTASFSYLEQKGWVGAAVSMVTGGELEFSGGGPSGYSLVPFRPLPSLPEWFSFPSASGAEAWAPGCPKQPLLRNLPWCPLPHPHRVPLATGASGPLLTGDSTTTFFSVDPRTSKFRGEALCPCLPFSPIAKA